MERFVKEYGAYLKKQYADDEVMVDMIQRVLRLRYRGVISTMECMNQLTKITAGTV